MKVNKIFKGLVIIFFFGALGLPQLALSEERSSINDKKENGKGEDGKGEDEKGEDGKGEDGKEENGKGENGKGENEKGEDGKGGNEKGEDGKGGNGKREEEVRKRETGDAARQTNDNTSSKDAFFSAVLASSRALFSKTIANVGANKNNSYWVDINYNEFKHDEEISMGSVGVIFGASPILEKNYSISGFVNIALIDSLLPKENTKSGKSQGNLVAGGITGRYTICNLDMDALIYVGYSNNDLELVTNEKKKDYGSHDFGLAFDFGYRFDINEAFSLKPLVQFSYLNSNIIKEKTLESYFVKGSLESSVIISKTIGATLDIGYNHLMRSQGTGKDLYRDKDRLDITLRLEKSLINGDKAALGLTVGQNFTTQNKSFSFGLGYRFR
ncbi:MAG: autotransporter domain-containing protein [Rickettsiales bacterium]|nr:autotransporter domain-containing protein [Rickettsiales bacterium]